MRWLWAASIRVVLILAVSVLMIDVIALGVQFPAAGTLALIALTWRRLRRRWHLSDAFGAARFATLADVLRGRLAEPSGLILGKLTHDPPRRGRALRALFSPFVKAEWACRLFFIAFLGSHWVGDVFLRIHNFTHLLTIAPAGGGKSVHTLVPNLLSYDGNCVVVDPKGELFRLTAEHRRKRFHHHVIRLDPAGLCGPGADQLNPFDFIDAASKAFLGSVRDLADMIVTRTGHEIDNHWNDSAANVIAAFTAYICACEGAPESRNLQGMRRFLASRENFSSAVAMMTETQGFNSVLSQLGHSLTWHVGKELASVMSCTQRHTTIFDDPMVAESTGCTTFNPADLRSERMTIYLIVPADRLVVWSGLVRVWIGTLLRQATRGAPTEVNPVLFLIDEAAHIGRMQILENAITLMRGAGVRIWLFFQSLDQLHRCFGDRATTVLDNLATQQYMSLSSYETAQAVSKRIGDHTILVRSRGSNRGYSWATGNTPQNSGSRNSGANDSLSEAGQPLLRAEEILTLPQSLVLVFHLNHPAIIAKRIWYYADKAFAKGGIGRSRGLGLRGALGAVIALLAAAASTVATCLAPAYMPSFRPRASSTDLKPGQRVWIEGLGWREWPDAPAPSWTPPYQPSRPVAPSYFPPPPPVPSRY